MAQDSVSSESINTDAAAVLTSTVFRSPVFRRIRHVRLRSWRHNDVVFVGDRFIQVKEVKDHGSLEHIIIKNDFDATIREAQTFSFEKTDHEEGSIIKKEAPSSGVTLPPQCLVLTLDSNDVIFLYLATNEEGEYRFVHQTCPMPVFERTMFQPGEYLAVDSTSRALAVAANEREVIIYAAKSKDRIEHQMRTGDPNWCPVSAQRPLQVDGVITQMDFLIPPSDDEDHVILLLIVVQERRTKAMWVDWHYSSDIHHAQIRDAHTLEQPSSVPGLLIPLRNAAFLLTNGSEIRRFPDLLSGSTANTTYTGVKYSPLFPGSSATQPIWTNWCRPLRGASSARDSEYIYLAREDGAIFLAEITNVHFGASHAGDMDCHVGAAFASLGAPRDPDILAAAGDMSTGCIVEIGERFSARPRPDRSRNEALRMNLVETVPNWTSATDMVASSLYGRTQRPRDALFVTSARQPFGTVTEFRYGLEARLSLFFEEDQRHSVNDVWALPRAGIGDMLIVESRPGVTSFLRLHVEDGEIIPEAFEFDGFEEDHETLLAVAMRDGRLVQVTQKNISVVAGTTASFEDRARIDCEGDDCILAAAMDLDVCLLVTAERATRTDGTRYSLVSYAVPTDNDVFSTDGALTRRRSIDLKSEPLALTVFQSASGRMGLVTTVAGSLLAFSIAQNGDFEAMGHTDLPHSTDGPSMCDNLAVLDCRASERTASTSHLAVCGLRDGRLCSIPVSFGQDFMFGSENVVDFSQSNVKLVQPISVTSTAYAMSGMDTCLLSGDGVSAESLAIQSIWLSDKNRPELAQGAILACTHTPSADLLSSSEFADSVVFISADEFLLTKLERDIAPVPRQIPVTGTPSRLLYSEAHRCLVCASLRYGLREFSSSPYERRQIWPVIDFIPSKSSEPSFTYDMQPGERVYTLLEWSLKLNEDKVYSFVLVGGSYVHARDQSTRGRISFLQPSNKNWNITGVKEGKALKFEASVYAIALVDDITFVATTGCNVVVFRFDLANKKWDLVSAAFTLNSPGIAVSVDRDSDTDSSPIISVSTSKDSLVFLRLEEEIDAEEPFEYRLVLQCTAPKADASLHHLSSITSATNPAGTSNDLALLTTKNGKLIGLRHPQWHTHSISANILFEAILPYSLTRIRQANIRPRWKADRPPGVLVDNIVGCSADGTVTGAVLIDGTLWRRLSWVQRLCEWSEELSPHSYQAPSYTITEETFARNERGMPIGLSRAAADRKSEVVMRTGRKAYHDRHIDGDKLLRILQHGEGGCLSDSIRATGQRQDATGEWVQAHLEEEMAAVDEMIDILHRLLDSWL